MRIVFLAVVSLASRPVAQPPAVATIVGTARDASTNAPVVGVNVFVRGTLDGALTDSVGRFTVVTPRRARYVLVARRVGYRESDRAVDDSTLGAPLALRLVPDVQTVAPVSVQAGRWVAADEPGAVLTPLDVVAIPGAAADVNRALQTLPGVQQVDEGTGLFVRGGDFTETRVYLNGGRLLTPAQLRSAAGTFVGTLDPFLLDAVYFTSGGFGARYGDALSAVADLHTQRRPESPSATLSAGLGAAGVSLAAPGPRGTGARLVLGREDLAPVLRLNGSPRQFTLAPRGGSATTSLYWSYRRTGTVSAFGTRQTSRVGALDETPSVTDTFATATQDRAIVVAWTDVVGRVRPEVVLSSSAARRADDYGAFRLVTPSRLDQLTASVETALGAVTWRAGVELARERAGVTGSVPADDADERPGARVRLYDVSRHGRRAAWFAEGDRRGDRWRVTAGLRGDRATAARAATLDPRVSGAVRAGHGVVITGAWGVYHQTVDPLLQALALDPASPLPAMRATHTILGAQLGDGAPMVRVEGYVKRYADLAGAGHDYVTASGGMGEARGVDLIARGRAAGVDARLVYSHVRSRRTDPSTGVVAPAPADVAHGLTAIATRPVAAGLTLGTSLRYAGGRPFTPVTSAERGADGVWIPTYGPPGSERLPAFARWDASASWFRVPRPGVQLVGYVALANLLDRSNVFARRYSADYTTRRDVRSVFNRSLYAGGVVTFLRP